MSPKILVVDDEPDIIEFIRYNLIKEGFTCETAKNGTEAVAKSLSFKPDLILMDVMMPGMDGIEACRRIKANPETANAFIMFLTARNEEFSEIAGFDAGGDDYVAKPIKPRALQSRIKSVLNRQLNFKNKESETLDLGNIKIDPSSYLVFIDDQQLNLPKKEFELLYLLASKPGKVFTREKILRKIWGEQIVVVDRTIDVHIRKIREKIGDERIETIKGVGYKFQALSETDQAR